MPRRSAPPKSCMECGATVFTWSKHPLCGKCVKEITEGRKKKESLRDFRKKLGRNKPNFRNEVK